MSNLVGSQEDDAWPAHLTGWGRRVDGGSAGATAGDGLRYEVSTGRSS